MPQTVTNPDTQSQNAILDISTKTKDLDSSELLNMDQTYPNLIYPGDCPLIEY